MIFQIEGATQEEQSLFYMNDKDACTERGCIGYLRGDFGRNGKEFHTTWFDHMPEIKSQNFKAEFDRLVNSLRDDDKYGILKNNDAMAEYCFAHKESDFYRNIYGFKLFGLHHTYFLRCNPRLLDYNFYIYCYDNRYLQPALTGKPYLPEICYGVVPSSGELVVIKAGETGYFRCDYSTDNPVQNKEFAFKWNEDQCISKAQESAMLAGSIFGFDKPAANPKNYDENGKLIKQRSKGVER